MLEKISKIKNLKKISKNSQSQINGGFGIGNSCSSLSTSQSCSQMNGCQWYGCYCGTNTPHIAIGIC